MVKIRIKTKTKRVDLPLFIPLIPLFFLIMSFPFLLRASYGQEPYPDPLPLLDLDNDGIEDSADNCMYFYNPDQSDMDGDSFGDACDNCSALPNRTSPMQIMMDGETFVKIAYRFIIPIKGTMIEMAWETLATIARTSIIRTRRMLTGMEWVIHATIARWSRIRISSMRIKIVSAMPVTHTSMRMEI